MMKIHRHDSTSTTIPPTTRARPAPSPIMPGIQPKAAASRGPFSVDRASARASGKVAVLTPCTTRAASSTPRFGATAASEGRGGEHHHRDEHDPAVAEAVTELADHGREDRAGQQERGEDPPRAEAASRRAPCPIVGRAGTTRVCMSENASTAALSAKVNRPG